MGVTELNKGNVSDSISSLNDHIVFLAAIFCFWFSTYIYIPTFGIYMERTGLSYTAIGIILGSYGISQVLLRLPLGILSNSLEKLKKWLLFIGMFLAFLSGIILVYFDSFVFILVARLLAGITASMWVIATILYADYFKKSRASQAMSILQLMTVATQFLSMILCGILVDHFGWDLPFWLGAISAFIGCLLVLKIKVVKLDEIVNADSIVLTLKKTFTLKRLKMVTFLSLIAHAILFITIFGFSPIYAVHIGIKESANIWLMCAFFVPHMVASLYLSFFKVDPKHNYRIMIYSFSVVAVFLFLIPFSNSLLTLSVLHMVIGLMLGFIFPILLGEVVILSPSELKLASMGFYQSFYAIGIFVGPMIAGRIAEKMGLNEVFMFTATLSFIGLLILWYTRRRTSNEVS